MNKLSEDATSRRHFLKRAGHAAVASALAGAAIPSVNAVQKGGGGERENAISKKLAEVLEQPLGQNSAFREIKRRMPGWRADTADDGQGNEEYYFPVLFGREVAETK